MRDASNDRTVLASLGFSGAPLIGSGGEANVYGVSGTEVLRLLHAGASRAELERRVRLLAEIDEGARALPFETPRTREIVACGGRLGTLEKRLPGRALDRALATRRGAARARMIRAWLDVAHRIAEIGVVRPGHGELLAEGGCTHRAFHDFWEERLHRSLRARPGLFDAVDAAAIARALPEPAAPALVHLDVFGGNLLWRRGEVTAVLDFGYSTIMGDDRLNGLFAAVFAASAPRSAHADDARTVRAWLREHALDAHFAAAERMVAAYWSFVDDDAPLDAWCRRVLLGGTARRDPRRDRPGRARSTTALNSGPTRPT